jgi:hypothetical protein
MDFGQGCVLCRKILSQLDRRSTSPYLPDPHTSSTTCRHIVVTIGSKNFFLAVEGSEA